MTKFAFLLPALALTLAACGEEPAPEPAATPVATPEPIDTLPAPDQELFTRVFAESCPAAEPVNTASCRRAGMGSPNVICEYGLGEDTYLRHEATLTEGEDEWVLADPEALCAEHDSHHSN